MDDRIINAFFSEFNRLVEESPDSLSALKSHNSEWAKKYLFKVLISVIELSEFQKEIELILSGFDAKPVGLFYLKPPSVDELILAVKMYLVAWSTTKDLTALLMNAVYDLGIDDSDVSFGIIIRNRKVTDSEVRKLLAKYQKELDIGGTSQARNDVVHRAKVPDIDLKELKAKRNGIEAQRYSWLVKDRISEDEYNKLIGVFHKELGETAARKKIYYTEHHKKNIAFLGELATNLARVFFSNLSEKRI